MFYLAIFLVLYGAFALFFSLTKKPTKMWNMGKVQGFVKILSEVGTQIFIFVFGGAALGIGIWLLIKNWPAA